MGRPRSRLKSSTIPKGRQEAKVVFRRRIRHLGCFQVSDLDTHSTGDNQRLFELAAWFAGFEFNNRSPVLERLASSVCLQPRILRFSLMAAPKSRADLSIEHLQGRLTGQEVFSICNIILTDREESGRRLQNHPGREVLLFCTIHGDHSDRAFQLERRSQRSSGVDQNGQALSAERLFVACRKCVRTRAAASWGSIFDTCPHNPQVTPRRTSLPKTGDSSVSRYGTVRLIFPETTRPRIFWVAEC
ncbi:hypothetical protein EV561_13523 [Rhizobium sp. BK376]|nr:hypothetical protein EV561_13523 [Rhizobium sp. BK376]